MLLIFNTPLGEVTCTARSTFRQTANAETDTGQVTPVFFGIQGSTCGAKSGTQGRGSIVRPSCLEVNEAQ
jgi:hypothetical protein